MEDELLNLLLSEENVDVTLGILRDGQKIKEKIRKDFCNQLVNLAGEYGLELVNNMMVISLRGIVIMVG